MRLSAPGVRGTADLSRSGHIVMSSTISLDHWKAENDAKAETLRRLQTSIEEQMRELASAQERIASLKALRGQALLQHLQGRSDAARWRAHTTRRASHAVGEGVVLGCSTRV